MIARRALAALVLVITPFAVNAQFSETPTSTSSGCIFPEPKGFICPAEHPGDATVATQGLSDVVNAFAGGISGMLKGQVTQRSDTAMASLGGPFASAARSEAGAAAGGMPGWGTWASVGFLNHDDDLSSTRSESDLTTVLVGADRVIFGDGVIGVSFGYERNSVETIFNQGDQRVTGWTIAPYFAYQLTQNLSFDLAFGVSQLSIDQDRLDSIDGTSRIIGDTDADRWFLSSNVHMSVPLNDFLIVGSAGLLFANQDIDAVIESGGPDAFTSAARSLDLGQVSFGVEASYIGWMLEPFASFQYMYEFDRDDLLINRGVAQPSNDDDSVRLGVGFRYFADNGLSATVQGNVLLGRQNFDGHEISLTARYQF